MPSDVEIARMGSLRFGVFFALNCIGEAWQLVFPHYKLALARKRGDLYAQMLDEERERAAAAEEAAFKKGFEMREEIVALNADEAWARYVREKNTFRRPNGVIVTFD